MKSQICLKITQGTIERDTDKEENGHTGWQLLHRGWRTEKSITLPSPPPPPYGPEPQVRDAPLRATVRTRAPQDKTSSNTVALCYRKYRKRLLSTSDSKMHFSPQ